MHDISLKENDDCMKTLKESGAVHRKLNFLQRRIILHLNLPCCIIKSNQTYMIVCTKFLAVKYWLTVLKYMYFKCKVLYLVCTIFDSTVNFQNVLKSNQYFKKVLKLFLTCFTLWRSSHLYTLPESFLVSAALILWFYVFDLK